MIIFLIPNSLISFFILISDSHSAMDERVCQTQAQSVCVLYPTREPSVPPFDPSPKRAKTTPVRDANTPSRSVAWDSW